MITKHNQKDHTASAPNLPGQTPRSTKKDKLAPQYGTGPQNSRGRRGFRGLGCHRDRCYSALELCKCRCRITCCTKCSPGSLGSSTQWQLHSGHSTCDGWGYKGQVCDTCTQGKVPVLGGVTRVTLRGQIFRLYWALFLLLWQAALCYPCMRAKVWRDWWRESEWSRA